MGNKIILFGASGHCKVVIDILKCNHINISTVVDDNPKTTTLLGIPVLHSDGFLQDGEQRVIVSIGDNAIRKKIVQRVGGNFYRAIHPQAIVSSFSTIGIGTVLMAGAIVNPDAIVGAHCIVNTAAVVEHDCVLEDYVHLSPHVSLAGGVKVGEGTHVGIGACVIQGVSLGKWVTIGAGSVILKDVPDYAVVVGNPGRIIKSKK